MCIRDRYKTGLISYFGSEWNEELELRLQALLAERKVDNFERLARLDPQVAGHIFWQYLNINYGKSTIGNLVYVTRINRNLKRAFQFALGIDYDTFLDQVFHYYQATYPAVKVSRRQEKRDRLLRLRSNEEVTAMHAQPQGNKFAVATNRLGKVQIRIVEPGNKKSKKLYSYGVRNKLQPPDRQYPVLAWSPDGNRLLNIYERRDHIYLREHDLQDGKSRVQIIPEKFYRIYSAAYLSPERVVLNATQDGYSNLFLYDLKTRQSKAIIDDPYDDLDIHGSDEGGKRVFYFSSNRKSALLRPISGDSVMPVGPFDIYRISPDDPGQKDISWKLEQVTFTEKYSESKPLLEAGQLHFFSDEYERRAVLSIPQDGRYETDDEALIYKRDNLLENYAISSASEVAAVSGFDGRKRYAVLIPAAELRQGNAASACLL